jgi:diadenosine tetraphosphatase ApaH/serine/threonine PP2A family protein phosphatase
MRKIPEMKIALITDLHANREAVEAVLDHALAQGTERWAFLGDFVGYGADPAWVVDWVRGFVRDGAIAVQGNHDSATVQGASPTMRPDAKEVIEWTRAQLSSEQLDFLNALPFTQRQGDQLYVHANAHAPQGWEYIQGRLEAVRSLHATDCRYVFCGHMHDFIPTGGVAIPVPSHRQWLVIPGSAGQPRDGNPAACYAMFDDAASMLTYHRVPYDHDTAGDKIRAAGLPDWLATRLADGQ